MSSKNVLLTIIFLMSIGSVKSQDAELGKTNRLIDYDSSYLQSFHNLLNARIYLSRKFTDLEIVENNDQRRLNYQPNSTVNLGIGATYKGFTLNLAYGFAFLNQEEGRGETRYLDLQTHMYGRKHAIDLFAQFYSGMYLENTRTFNALFPDQFYLRPDLRINMIGGGYTRVFNHERFSYAASLVQSEYQKKSAGSFLLGGKLILFGATADSSIVPNWSSDTLFKAFVGVTEMGGFQLGPGLGYAHTFVAWKKWFLTLSFELNFMLGPVSYSLENGEELQEFQLNPASDFKLAAGYNSPETYLGLMLVDNQSTLQSVDGSMFATFGVGNIRFNYVKRFNLNQKWKNRLNKLPL